ncbi:phospholipase D-like domain-containing protein [Rhodanobacter sp. AS-Z3]|uniref:phospholipase D-like domain-containing protein n=1 Tax=Rhodanobacter sp. AS-Z3 TaxID=3031330 RepID=UPI0024798C79|nr:phospholipase D-like domain-containing protein [Rhodanobacter sp. AS-Z3]WEN13962.1 phospholipase D-like domain-containing protein [Rhodanobacter sp. AS-Z3]
MWIVILVTVVITTLIVMISMNFHRPEKSVRHHVKHCHPIDDPQFKLEMDAMLGPAVLDGNAITALQNGDEIFPAMLQAIRGAKCSITFETYIYWSGDIGKLFADALKERCQAGVAVHVMLDWAGSAKMDGRLLDELTDAGVEVERYHPLRWYSIARLNNRTHRKLLVVDGRIGFTGGVGIADQWQGHAQDPEHWRDIHFRVEGRVVAQLQAGFMDNWIKTTGRVLHSDLYYPRLQPAGNNGMHLFVSSPAGGNASMRLMYLLALAAASRSIDLQAAYFIPDRLVVDALLDARKRGVAIRLLVPGHYIDSSLVRMASKRRWGRLLTAGVEIFEYTPTMMHNKMLILDAELTSVGSTNFDMRSFDLNDEASLNVYSREFGQQMTAVMDADLQHAKPYTLAKWKQRSWKQKLGELLVRPVESQL